MSLRNQRVTPLFHKQAHGLTFQEWRDLAGLLSIPCPGGGLQETLTSSSGQSHHLKSLPHVNPYVFYFNLNISWTYCSWWINKTCLGLLRVLYNKFPWMEWLKSQILTLSVLEAGSQQGRFLVRILLLPFRWQPSHHACGWMEGRRSNFLVSLLAVSSHKGTNPIRPGVCLHDLI